jgi:hypothetical protein
MCIRKLALIVFLITLPYYGNSSEVTIKNDDYVSVEIVIQADEFAKKIMYIIGPKKQITIYVTKDLIGDADVFEIIVRGRIPLKEKKCAELFIEKNYKVTLVGTKNNGTLCYKDEWPK